MKVQTDNRMITVKVSGEGRLVALDSGDLRLNKFYTNQIKSYFGHALLTVAIYT